jgi:hypothetical protein
MRTYILLEFFIFSNTYQSNDKYDKTLFYSFSLIFNMIENTLSILCLCYVCIFITFIISFCISQYYNSPRLIHLISIISSISILVISVFLKIQSSWFVLSPQAAFSLSGFGIFSALKYLELAFGYKWTYTRQMPLKLVVMYLLALPKMPESEEKLSDLSRQYVRRESIVSISRGICQFIILRTVLYLIPIGWLSLSSSSFPPLFRFLRYALLTFLLYLSVDFVSGIGFGIYGIIFKLRMNSVFPAFPFVATSLRDFWSYRWNNLIKSSLHLISFVVLPKLIDPIIPMNKVAKSLFAFTLSGFIHEYAIWFVSGNWSGKNMIFFLLHGLLVLLEITIHLPVKPNTLKGKLMGWIWTTGITLMTSPLFFDPLIEAGVFASMK